MKNEFKKLYGSKTLLHIGMLILLFLAGDLLSSILFDLIFKYIELSQKWMYYVFRSVGCLILTCVLFFIYTKIFLHQKISFFRIDFKIKSIDILYAVLLPAFVILIYTAIGKFTFNDSISSGIKYGIIFDSLTRALRAGILEEILFRGYIMKLLENKWNKYIAIIIPSFVFSLLHIPSMENFNLAGVILLITSGTLVGIMFSLVTYKNDSIFGSTMIHILWNFFMATDILHIFFANDKLGSSIFSITLPSENVLLTGAGFGIEASLISIIGYLIVSMIAIYSMRIKRSRTL